MGKSYGFIEITGVVAAMDALEIMCKTADVELASWERKLGGRLVTIIIEGDVSAVTEAVEAAVAGAIKKPVSYAVIAKGFAKLGDWQKAANFYEKAIKKAGHDEKMLLLGDLGLAYIKTGLLENAKDCLEKF